MNQQSLPSRKLFHEFSLWVGYLTLASGISLGIISPFVLWRVDSSAVETMVNLKRVEHSMQLLDPKWTAAGRIQLEGAHSMEIESIQGKFWLLWLCHSFLAVTGMGVVVCTSSVTVKTFSDNLEEM